MIISDDLCIFYCNGGAKQGTPGPLTLKKRLQERVFLVFPDRRFSVYARLSFRYLPGTDRVSNYAFPTSC